MSFCSNCGKELKSGAWFCDACGMALGAKESWTTKKILSMESWKWIMAIVGITLAVVVGKLIGNGIDKMADTHFEREAHAQAVADAVAEKSRQKAKDRIEFAKQASDTPCKDNLMAEVKEAIADGDDDPELFTFVAMIPLMAETQCVELDARSKVREVPRVLMSYESSFLAAVAEMGCCNFTKDDLIFVLPTSTSFTYTISDDASICTAMAKKDIGNFRKGSTITSRYDKVNDEFVHSSSQRDAAQKYIGSFFDDY